MGACRRLTPAEYVIRTFGGATRLAKALGRNRSAVTKWPYPRRRDGCDGKIPTSLQKKILDLALERGLDVTPSDLICGRSLKGPSHENRRMPNAG